MSETGSDTVGKSGKRAARIDTHRVRLGNREGILLNLSATGALVRVPIAFAIGTEAALVVHADEHYLRLPCRIVRCTETQVSLEGAAWRHAEFDTAVLFDEHSDALQTLLELFQREKQSREGKSA